MEYCRARQAGQEVGRACPTGKGTPEGSCPAPSPRSFLGAGGVIHRRETFIFTNPQDRVLFFLTKEMGRGQGKFWRGDSGVYGTLTGMLMRGRDPGSSQERLKAMEDTLEAQKGQFDVVGKKNCRRRG